jgi:hypothetical protein
MSGKPGILLVKVIKDSDYVGEDEATPTYLTYNGYSEKYAEQLEILLDRHAHTLRGVLGGYYMIRTIRFDSANNLGEAKFAAACLAWADNDRGVDDSQVVEYDTAGFKDLLARVTELVSEFKTDVEELDDEYYYGEYVDEHIDSLIYAIDG